MALLTCACSGISGSHLLVSPCHEQVAFRSIRTGTSSSTASWPDSAPLAEQCPLTTQAVRCMHAAAQVATAVADEAFKQGVACIKRPANLRAFIEHRMWEPTKAHLNASTPFTSPQVTPQVMPPRVCKRNALPVVPEGKRTWIAGGNSTLVLTCLFSVSLSLQDVSRYLRFLGI